ncbi:MAG: hypothetical protein Q8916_04225 [Bacteroidota bacterium]|nr:hypothetical protein [Bacteroidota bacterium]MDP4229596.1 hypothetical protein [Bacteroidota bacterium]MDP4236326.1 hypothetical protein [Bacteroidota bacterium]
MALLRRRYASFGREDKTFGIRALIKGDSWAVRIGVFVILSALFVLIVQLTHHRVNPEILKQGQSAPFPEDTK